MTIIQESVHGYAPKPFGVFTGIAQRDGENRVSIQRGPPLPPPRSPFWESIELATVLTETVLGLTIIIVQLMGTLFHLVPEDRVPKMSVLDGHHDHPGVDGRDTETGSRRCGHAELVRFSEGQSLVTN